MAILTADQLNTIGQNSGYQGGTFSSVGLPQATAPSSVANVNPLASAQLPTNTPSTGNVSNAVATNSGASTQIDAMQQYFKDQADLAKQQADALQSEQSNAKKSVLDIFNSTPSATESRANAYQQIGIDPSQYFADQKSKIAEIDTLNQEYSSIKSAADQQKAQLIGQGRGIPTDFLNNQAAQIDRNAAPRLNMLSANINSKAATLQALQGNFNEARSFVDQAVQDATADTKFKLDTIKTFYDMNQDTISRLDTKYQNALQTSLGLAKDKYELELQTNSEVGDLMLKYPNAGIKIGQSLSEAQTKAARWSAANPTVNNTASNQQLDNERALLNQFNSEPIVKDYNIILGKKMNVDNIIKSGVGGPGDLAVVYEFMKGLDPTSVVRESEYATAAKSGNIFLGSLAKFNGYFKETGGFMPKSTSEAFQSIVNSKLNTQTQLYNNVKKQYEGVAGRQGLNPQNVVLDYGAGATTQSVAPTLEEQASSIFDQVVEPETKSGGYLSNLWNAIIGK